MSRCQGRFPVQRLYFPRVSGDEPPAPEAGKPAAVHFPRVSGDEPQATTRASIAL